MSVGRFANLVSSRMSGNPFSTADARSTQTRVPSHVDIADAGARSSGFPQQDAATRSTMVLPVVVLPHRSMMKLGASRIARSGGASDPYNAINAGGCAAMTPTPSRQLS